MERYLTVKVYLTYIFLFLLCASGTEAQSYFEYNKEVSDIYADILDLKLDKARSSIKSLKETQSQNLAIIHIENYVDFFQIFITEEKEAFEILEKNLKKRLKILDKQADKNDPHYLFVVAEINLQWALIRSKFNQLFKAGREIINAFQYLKENQKKHPDFIYNKKSLSIIHALIETVSIPGILKGFFGIEGTIKQGIREINEVLDYADNNDFIFLKEAEAIKSFILLYQSNNKEAAWQTIAGSSIDAKESPLSCFMQAKIAQRTGQNDKAIEMLSSFELNEDQEAFNYLNYMLGFSKLRRLDQDADVYLKKFITDFKGRHYIKEAYQKLAWYELVINENIPGYKKYNNLVLTYGETLIDDDKQAQKEAEKAEIPHPELLKARLLFDGGYYQKAYRLLIRKGHLFFNDQTYLLEYNYRMGRINQALKNYPDALQFYGTTINEGKSSQSYLACNAALQMGIIYESQKDWEKSKKFYEECLSQSPEEYKNSLHQKAKTGLNRIKSKK